MAGRGAECAGRAMPRGCHAGSALEWRIALPLVSRGRHGQRAYLVGDGDVTSVMAYAVLRTGLQSNVPCSLVECATI